MEELKTNGVAMMPYQPELRQLVEKAAASWQDFCALPIEDKQHYAELGSMMGYELKDGSGPNGDQKENFDIASTIGDTEIDTSNAPEFITDAVAISKAMAGLALSFAQQVDAQYHIPELVERTAESGDQIFTRFIHYYGDRTAGEETASTHCDQSGYTFHLFETADGCQRLDYTTREWVDMPVEEGKMAAFPAMQLQLLSEGELPALAHRVVATQATQRAGRHAIVSFVRLKNVPEYDKKTHGRLQEFEPGFNYDMTQRDFGKLFT